MEETSIPDTPESLYREEISSVDIDELPGMLAEVAQTFIPDPDIGMIATFKKGMELFHVEDDIELHYETFQKSYYKALHKVIVLHHRFAEEGLLLESEGDQCVNNLITFNKLFEVFHYWEFAIRSTSYVRKASNRLYDSSMNTDIGLFRFKPIDPESNNCFQNLILYLLTVLAKRSWRRQDDQCMERIYTDDGYDTHAWRPVMDIKTFVYSVSQMDINYQQWYNLTQSANNAASATKYLTSVCDLHFIDVVKNRKLFSFPNGIYESAIWDEITGTYKDKWYPHCKTREESPNGNMSHDIGPKISACKHFDKPFDNFDECDDWYDIPTPHFQSILDYQGFSEEVSRWMYILVCGRLLHEVCDLDEWQVMPFLKGKAKTGKSTILTRVCKQFFHALDVGVISNNVETRFGLSAVDDKMLFIAPEVNEKFQLDQCDFQTMISGEDTSVAVKFQTAKAVRWTVPGAMAGNSSPGYSDNQGSISRRLIVFAFRNKVIKGDTQLGKKLDGEIAAILKKGNRAYIEAVNRHGDCDIWSVLPKYFHDTRDQESEASNTLVAFMKSDDVQFGNDFYCEKGEMMMAIKQFCTINGFNHLPWKKDQFESVFDDLGLVYYTNKRPECIKSGPKAYIYGVRLSDSNEDESEDDM
jgi:hypothetical protein